MIRSVLLIAAGIFVTAYFAAFIVVLAFLRVEENLLHKAARLWARVMLAVSGVRVTVVGTEHLLMNRPQIFMANHQSDFDIFILLAKISAQFRWIAKKELFRVPVFGKAMQRAGYIELDRQDRSQAIRGLEAAALAIRNGKSIMSFPEGTRSHDGSLQPFKHGLFHLALQTGVPIVPISIIGAADIMPKRSLKIRPGLITVVIGAPIETAAYTTETRLVLMETVRAAILAGMTPPEPPRLIVDDAETEADAWV